MICYNFMAGLGWTRTNQSVKERGGALTSEFDLEAAKAQGLTRAGEVSEEKMWRNCEYFIKAVMPVADKFKVKMALHPDDPPHQSAAGHRAHRRQQAELRANHGHVSRARTTASRTARPISC